MPAIEPEIIFEDGRSSVEIEATRSVAYKVGFGIKIFIMSAIGIFVMLVIMICFPISALCTLGTVVTTTIRLIVTRISRLIRGTQP